MRPIASCCRPEFSAGSNWLTYHANWALLSPMIAVSVVAMVKAVNGQRFRIPGISEYADRF